jgi:hypothetical protein
VENLAHSASFHAGEKTAPSNPGIKQLDEIRHDETAPLEAHEPEAK